MLFFCGSSRGSDLMRFEGSILSLGAESVDQDPSLERQQLFFLRSVQCFLVIGPHSISITIWQEHVGRLARVLVLDLSNVSNRFTF